MPYFTVFTSTYNRGYTLFRLYESLKNQGTTDFEWLIVNDGSTDNTHQLVEEWIRKEKEFSIRYLEKENGGKPRAINYGIRYARGKFFFMVDSDDFLLPNALSKMKNWCKEIENNSDYIGVGAARGFPDGSYIKGVSPIVNEQGYVDATNLQRIQFNLDADMCEAYKTKILKKYPMPEWPGEKFAPEQIALNEIALDGYKLRWHSDIIYQCNYLDDGLTKGSKVLEKNNPMGYAMMYCHMLKYPECSKKQKFYAACQVVALSIVQEFFWVQLLHSIEIQNYPHIEVVVVNDGSIDQSESKILEWKEVLENKKISLIYIKQKNQGIGSAINTGLKYISGEYLLLLDIDDEYLQGALLERVQFLESHREMDVVRSNGWYVRKNGKSLFIYDECEKNIQDVFTALLEGKTNNWAGSYMVRVSSLFKFYPEREIYQSKYGQNLQLLLPLLYNKKCGFIDKPHMNYNQQENSLTKTNVEKSKKKKSLDNANGFRDIREHMVQIIIHDEREREYYLDIIQNFYWRSVMQIAGVYNDDILMKEAFLKLKINKNVQLDDYIIYCRLTHPELVLLLRLFRKIKSKLGNL